MKLAKTKTNPSTDETSFWQWVDAQKSSGWVRYDVDVARALASTPAALILASAIHRTCIRSSSIHASGRWFYMSVVDWVEALYLRKADVMRALSLLCVDIKPRSIQFQSAAAGAGRPGKAGVRVGRVRRARLSGYGLGLIQRWVTNRSAAGGSVVTHYRVDFERLRAWWQTNGLGQAELQVAGQGAQPIGVDITDLGGVSLVGAFVQTEQIDLLGQNKLVCSPVSNQFVATEQTSGNFPQEEPSRNDPTNLGASVSASARRGDALKLGECNLLGFDLSVFDEWAKTDTAQAMRVLLGREGLSNERGMVTTCLVRLWERDMNYTDLLAGVADLRREFEASISLKDWQGWLVSNILQGSVGVTV